MNINYKDSALALARHQINLAKEQEEESKKNQVPPEFYDPDFADGFHFPCPQGNNLKALIVRD